MIILVEEPDSQQQWAPSLWEMVNSGIRSRFKVINKSDVNQWCAENKGYDVSVQLKQQETWPLFAKIIKTMMLLHKRDALEQQRALSAKKHEDSKREGSAKKEEAVDPKKKKLKERIKEVKNEQVMDEPLDGPNVYFLIRGFCHYEFVHTLLEDCNCGIDLVLSVSKNDFSMNLKQVCNMLTFNALWKNIAFGSVDLAMDSDAFDARGAFDVMAKYVYSVIDCKRKYSDCYEKTRQIEIIGRDICVTKSAAFPNQLESLRRITKKSLMVDLRHYQALMDSIPEESFVSVELILAAVVEQVVRTVGPPRSSNPAHSQSDIKQVSEQQTVAIHEDLAKLTLYLDKIMDKYIVHQGKTSLSTPMVQEDAKKSLPVIIYGDDIGEKGNSSTTEFEWSLKDIERKYQNMYSTNAYLLNKPRNSTFSMTESTNLSFVSERQPSLVEIHEYSSFLCNENIDAKKREMKIQHLLSISRFPKFMVERFLIQYEFEKLLDHVCPKEMPWSLSDWHFQEHLDNQVLIQRIQKIAVDHPLHFSRTLEDNGFRLLVLARPVPSQMHNPALFSKSINVRKYIPSLRKVPTKIGFGAFFDDNPTTITKKKYVYDTSNIEVLIENQCHYLYPIDGSCLRIKHTGEKFAQKVSYPTMTLTLQDNVYQWCFNPLFFNAILEDGTVFSFHPSDQLQNDDITNQTSVSLSNKVGLYSHFYSRGAISQQLPRHANSEIARENNFVEKRVFLKQGIVIFSYKLGNQKTFYPDGKIVTTDASGLTTVTLMNGNRYVQRPDGTIKHLQPLQHIRQYFEETKQTVITRGDLTVLSIMDETGVAVVEYPDSELKITMNLDLPMNVGRLSFLIADEKALFQTLADGKYLKAIAIEVSKPFQLKLLYSGNSFKYIESESVLSKSESNLFRYEKNNGLSVVVNEPLIQFRFPDYGDTPEQKTNLSYSINLANKRLEITHESNLLYTVTAQGEIAIFFKHIEHVLKTLRTTEHPIQINKSRLSLLSGLSRESAASIVFKSLANRKFSVLSDRIDVKLFIIKDDGTGIEFLTEKDILPFVRAAALDGQCHVMEEIIDESGDAVTMTMIMKRQRMFNESLENYLLYRQLVYYPKVDQANREELLEEMNQCEELDDAQNEYVDANARSEISVHSTQSSFNLVYGGLHLHQLQGTTLDAVEILEKYQQVELSRSTHQELQMKLKRKMFHEARKQTSSIEKSASVNPLRHTSSKLKGDRKASSAKGSSPAWLKFKKMLDENPLGGKYWDSDSGREFLFQESLMEDQKQASKSETFNKPFVPAIPMRYANVPLPYTSFDEPEIKELQVLTTKQTKHKRKPKKVIEKEEEEKTVTEAPKPPKQRPIDVNVIGEPRKSKVPIPTYMRSGQPNCVENEKFKVIELPVRRRLKTASTAVLETDELPTGLLISPKKIEFGILCQGFRYRTFFTVWNIGVDAVRFNIKTIPSDSPMKIHYQPGIIAAGMKVKVFVDLDATLPNPQMLSYDFTDKLEIQSEFLFMSIQIKASMLRFSSFHDAKKKNPRKAMHPKTVQLIAQDGQKEEIPIDELY